MQSSCSSDIECTSRRKIRYSRGAGPKIQNGPKYEISSAIARSHRAYNDHTWKYNNNLNYLTRTAEGTLGGVFGWFLRPRGLAACDFYRAGGNEGLQPP